MVHVIGKCPVKGCKNRRRNTFPGRIHTDRHGTHTLWGIPTEHGEESAHCTFAPPRLRYVNPDRQFERAWAEAMISLGWLCTDHDLFMTVTPVRGVVNVDKPCSARCQGATGPSCECVCGGEMHGASWA